MRQTNLQTKSFQDLKDIFDDFHYNVEICVIKKDLYYRLR